MSRGLGKLQREALEILIAADGGVGDDPDAAFFWYWEYDRPTSFDMMGMIDKPEMLATARLNAHLLTVREIIEKMNDIHDPDVMFKSKAMHRALRGLADHGYIQRMTKHFMQVNSPRTMISVSVGGHNTSAGDAYYGSSYSAPGWYVTPEGRDAKRKAE